MAETIQEKGQRLAKAGKASTYDRPAVEVEGDNGTYLVYVDHEGITQCTCPAGREDTTCSHKYAATYAISGGLLARE